MFRNKGRYEDDTKSFQRFSEALRPRDRGSEGGEDNVNGQPADKSAIVTTPLPAASTTPAPAATGPTPGATPPKPSPTAPEACASIVSLGSAWEGTLKIDGSVRVDGRLSGEVEARDTVYVAESAQVNAKVRASFVIVAGQFQGEVHCGERFELMPTGRFKGEMTTKTLVVHEGAFAEGQVHMTTDSPFSGNQSGKAARSNNSGTNERQDGGTPATTGAKSS